LFISLFLSLIGWSQPTFTAIVAGSVVDSTTGAGIPNYPVFIVDSSSAIGGISLTLLTDANGYYNDTLLIYSNAGILLVSTEDSCSGNWLSDHYVYTGNTPTYFSLYSTFYICGSNGTGGGGPGGGGGSGGSGNNHCHASFAFDSTLTGNGQIVLYNTSTVDSALQNANINYHWTWGDGSASFGAFPSHQYTQSGHFVICLTQTATDSTALGVFTCTSTYCDTISIDSTGNVSYKGVNVLVNVYSPDQMSINNDDLHELTIYPNPSRGMVRIELDTKAEIVVIDALGRTVFEAENAERIQLSDLPKGTYIVRTLSENGMRSQIFMVQ
jgi:hypothetical protein